MKRKMVYPKHAKAFAKPLSLSRLGRKQVGANFFVRRYADSFKKKGFKGVDLARAIAEDTARFERVELPEKKAEALWAKRRPWEIIKTRKAVIGKISESSYIMACTDIAQATVAAFRAAGFKALIVRRNVHTYAKVLVKEDGKWKVYIANPVQGKTFREINAGDIREEKTLESQKRFAEGQSLEEIGIRGFEDFYRFWPRLGKRRL